MVCFLMMVVDIISYRITIINYSHVCERGTCSEVCVGVDMCKYDLSLLGIPNRNDPVTIYC